MTKSPVIAAIDAGTGFTMRIPPIADTHSKLIADSVPSDRGHPERGA